MKLVRKPSLFSFIPHDIVSNHEIYGRRCKKVDSAGNITDERAFNDDGLFSEAIFGNFETEQEYTCKCHSMTGKFYEGCECPKCHTIVSFVESNINKCGWIDLSGNKYREDGTVVEFGEGYKVIKYVAYMFLERLIGKTNLKQIIKTPNIINIEGDLDEEVIKKIQNESPEKKYWHIGLMGFFQKYTEVLTYYYGINKVNDEELFNFLCDPLEVFTDKIPVISTLLRPAVRTADGLKLDEINTIYVRIIKNNKILNSKVNQLQLIKNSMLEMIQAEYFQLSEYIIESISGKEGLIRRQICGTRIDFTARNIITPADANIGAEEVVVPYLTFLELYRFELINIISHVKNVSIKEADNIVRKAKTTFNREVYLVMKKMIADEECSILLNRNPTIALGSIMYMRIADVKEDMSDLTLSVSNTILTPLAADYDGDVLNIISVKDKEMKEVFKEVMSPSALIIDANTGDINYSLTLERDQILGLNSLID